METEKAGQAAKLVALMCNVARGALLQEALRAARVPLTSTQYLGLRFVILHPGACVRDIAAGLQTSHSAAVKLTERLERRGFITRTRATDDRRRVCVAPTPTGRHAYEAVRTAYTRLLGQILDGMGGEEEADALIDWIGRFVKAALRTHEYVTRVCLYCGVEHDIGCLVSKAEEMVTGRPREVY